MVNYKKIFGATTLASGLVAALLSSNGDINFRYSPIKSGQKIERNFGLDSNFQYTNHFGQHNPPFPQNSLPKSTRKQGLNELLDYGIQASIEDRVDDNSIIFKRTEFFSGNIDDLIIKLEVIYDENSGYSFDMEIKDYNNVLEDFVESRGYVDNGAKGWLNKWDEISFKSIEKSEIESAQWSANSYFLRHMKFLNQGEFCPSFDLRFPLCIDGKAHHNFGGEGTELIGYYQDKHLEIMRKKNEFLRNANTEYQYLLQRIIRELVSQGKISF